MACNEGSGAGGPVRASRDGLCAGGRARQPADGADRPARQARRLFRRQVAHHRFRAVERAQLRHPPHRGGDAIQGAQPDPPHAARLELLPARAQRELRRPARLAARVGDDVVSRHRRRGLSEHRHHRELRPAIHGHPRRRPHLQDGLREDAATARRVRRRRDGRLSGGVAARRRRASASCMSTSTTASSPSSKSRRTRRRCRAAPTSRCAAWASMCSTPSSSSRNCAATPPIPNSSHDFGKDMIPYLVTNGKAVAHHFARSCVRSREESHDLLARRRHRRRLLAGQYRPHRHRARPRSLRSRMADLDLWRDHAAGQVRP